MAGAPSIERGLGLSHRGYTALVFAVPLILAALLEGPIALLSDVWGRQRLVVAGQGALAAALFFTAWTRSAWGLTIGLALAGAASGVACGAAQAVLVVSDSRGADRAMVRWALFSSIGDVLTPLATALAIGLGYSYRGAMAAIAVVASLQCVGSARAAANAPAGRSPDRAPEEDSSRAALARAVRRPRLWVWLFAAASCTLLDELVVALAALRLAREQGVSEALAAAAAVTFAIGSVLGSAWTGRAVAQLGVRRLLLASGALCAIALTTVDGARTPLLSCVALFVIGVTCAPHHPLAQAQAYGEMPNHPGTVQAIAQIFVVVDVVAPLALGFIADRWGLRAAFACLVVQPAVIVVSAASSARRAEPRRSPEREPMP